MLYRDEKDMIIHTAGFIGHLEKTKFGNEVLNKKAVIMLDSVLSSIVKNTTSTEDDIKSLLKELDKKKYEVAIITNHDKQARLNAKKQKVVEIYEEDLDTIKEYALQFCGQDCKRNITKCMFRKALKRSKTPPFNAENKKWGKCEYDTSL